MVSMGAAHEDVAFDTLNGVGCDKNILGDYAVVAFSPPLAQRIPFGGINVAGLPGLFKIGRRARTRGQGGDSRAWSGTPQKRLPRGGRRVAGRMGKENGVSDGI